MGVRADKFVWCVRLSKTRSDAAEMLRMGRILINGVSAKPSREVVVGDIIGIRRMPAFFEYRVKGLIERRVGARLVGDFLVDITSVQEVEKLAISRISMSGVRDRGSGRPTKRERREIDEFTSYDWLDLED